MNSLANILERFNRKERNLLIRDILECRDEPLPLGIDFRTRLAAAIEIPLELLDNAWWTTDFHFDWLAGALLIFAKGEPQTQRPNSGLILGNQEDIDLVVVAQEPGTISHHLILIEAKAYGYFTTEQFSSKLARLERLYSFYKELEDHNNPIPKIQFHFVLYSPAKPKKLELKPLPWPSGDAAVPATIPHVQLKLGRRTGSVLAVTRCNVEGKPDAGGDSWICVSVPETAPLSLRAHG